MARFTAANDEYVRRNRALLVTPRQAYVGWMFARFAPGLMQRMAIRFVARQRAATATETAT